MRTAWEWDAVYSHTCGLSGSEGVGGWYVGCWRSGLNVEKAAIEDLEVCILDARAIVDNMIDMFCFASRRKELRSCSHA